MSASIDDIAITIISNGETAYYSSFKGCGHIFWEVDAQIFSDNKPEAKKVFDFLKKNKSEGWDDESVLSLDEPLVDPIYGILIIDYDKKQIIDNNGYGLMNQMFLEWFKNSLTSAKTKKPGYLSNKTVKYHLKNGNIYFSKLHGEVQSFLPSTIDEALNTFESIKGMIRYDLDIDWVSIKLPDDWTHIIPEEEDNSEQE